MYTVHIDKECSCFKKSEYENNKTFKNQKDAYNYATLVAEFMTEEFCGQHIFTAHRGEERSFIVSVKINLDVVTGTTAHITCDIGCGSTDNWSLEDRGKII